MSSHSSQSDQSLLRGQEETILQSSKLMLSQGPPISPDAHTLSPPHISTSTFPTLSPTLDHHSDVGHTALFPVLDSVTSLPGMQMSEHMDQGESSGADSASDKGGMTWLDAAQAPNEKHYVAPSRVQMELSHGIKRRYSTAEDRANQNERYRQKYKKLRKIVKSMIFENAAICDEVAKTQEKLTKTKEERKFLLKRLFQYQTLSDVASLSNTAQHSGMSTPQSAMFGGLGEASSAHTLNTQGSSGGSGGSGSKHKDRSGDKKDRSKQKKDVKTEMSSKNKSRTKRKKPTDVKKLVTTIPLDPTGKPIFPIVLGGLTVHSLGDIQAKAGFHDEDYIFPVGFCSTRVFASFNNPSQKCLYTCKILDNGIRPKFEIDPEDGPDHPIICSSATECHKRLLKAINLSLGRDLLATDQGSGPEFFGFSHPTIQNLIQSCPGARKCTEYKWKKFEPCKPTERDDMIASMSENDNTISFDAFVKTKNIGLERERELYVQSQLAALEGSASSLRTLLTTGMPASISSTQMTSPQSLMTSPPVSIMSPTSLMTSPELMMSSPSQLSSNTSRE
ncbi:transforming growth factor beta regulator 1-like isoform X2 [Glandiceps talaboti]